MALQEVGVKLVLDGLGGFMSGLGDANRALENLGQSANGLSWDDAANRWRNAAGQFATNAETAAAGLENFASRSNAAGQSAGGGFNALQTVATGALHQIGAAAVNAGAQLGMAFGGFIAQSVSAAGEFEDGMNQFGAAVGGNLEAAGMDLKDFEALFLEMGQKLPVSTMEVQQAALALAKGGLDPAVIAAGGLEDSLNFAAAAGMGLEEAAELGVKMLGTFTSVTDDAATKTAFLAESQDLLVKAANASTLNVDALGDAMLAAGGQARAVGLDYQDFVTTMGLISPAFGSAAEAGTSFKNFLVRLQPSTQPAKDAMAGLGLMTTDTTRLMQFLAQQGIEPLGTDLDTLGNQFTEFAASQGWTAKEMEKVWSSFDQSKFYDAQGNFVGVQQAAQLLQDSLAGLTDAQRVQALQTIFGNDAMGAAAALADGGAAAYQAFAEQMANANGVQAQAAAVNQGLDFQMQNFQGSVEALQITLGTMLVPVLTKVFEEILTPAINTVLTFTQALSGNQTAMASLSPALQTAATVLQALGSALMDAGPFSIEFAEALSLVHPALQPMMLGIMDAANWLQGNWQTAVAVAGGVLAAVLAPAIAGAAAAFGAAVVAAAPVIAILAAVGVAAAALKGAWDQNLGGIQEKTAAAMAAVQGVISSVLGAVTQFWAENGAQITAFAQQAWGQVQQIIGGVVAIVAEVVTRVFTGIQQFMSDHGAEIQAVLQFAWNSIQNVITLALNTVQGIVNTVLALIKGDWDTAGQEIMNIVEGMATFVQDQFNNLLTLITNLGPEWLGGAIELAGNLVDGLVQGITNGAQAVIDTLVGLATNALNAAKEFLGIQSPSKVFASQVGKPITEGIAEGVLAARPTLLRALDTLGADALKQFEGLAGKLGKLIDENMSGRAGMLRSRAGNIDIVGQFAEAARKAEEARQDFVKNLPRVTREEYTRELAKLEVAAVDAANQLAAVQGELDEATRQATEIGRLDARAGADYLAKRQAQIKEILDLQRAVNEAADPGSRARAQAQLNLVRQAQAIELEQLRAQIGKRGAELGALGSDFEKTGVALVDGVIAGFQSRQAEMAKTLTDVLTAALKAAQASLGIKSPSVVFAQEVGAPISQGIAEGVAGAAGVALNAVGNLANSLVRPAAPALPRGMAGSSSVTNNYNYSPSYQGAPRQPTQDFAAMRVLATAR